LDKYLTFFQVIADFACLLQAEKGCGYKLTHFLGSLIFWYLISEIWAFVCLESLTIDVGKT
jgi:hypothetical protein